ncbi:hypothetical protein BD289DRAFT_282206 [Coniella lustricola]|uniref:Uncharacterized protein n=1 Tax=Coniella lustricola TaxID=2025994 RepID=A0A2T3A5V0_9PEZI|nr:hypothetical protein BD289DRAFT_282206 [Coniella lustricola]
MVFSFPIDNALCGWLTQPRDLHGLLLHLASKRQRGSLHRHNSGSYSGVLFQAGRVKRGKSCANWTSQLKTCETRVIISGFHVSCKPLEKQRLGIMYAVLFHLEPRRPRHPFASFPWAPSRLLLIDRKNKHKKKEKEKNSKHKYSKTSAVTSVQLRCYPKAPSSPPSFLSTNIRFGD